MIKKDICYFCKNHLKDEEELLLYFLKKIKLEVNDDLLSYAMAKSDTIPQLELFRGQCKPIWLFMASGDSTTIISNIMVAFF